MSLADGLGEGRVRVDELGDLSRQGLPVDDQLGLGDEVTDPAADEVHSEYGPVVGGDDLDRAGRLEDLRPAVAGEVVHDLGDLVATFTCLGRRQADGGDLGLAVGDLRHAVVVDRRRVEAGDVLGDHDALGKPDVGELQAGAQVADGV